jgi:hypothetical protein
MKVFKNLASFYFFGYLLELRIEFDDFFYNFFFSNSIDKITSKNTKFSKIPFGKDCPQKNANLGQK